MATMNPFDLLGDDAEDPSQLIAAEQLKAAAAAAAAPKKGQEPGKTGSRAGQPQQNKLAQLPTKPPPPAQAGVFLDLLGLLIIFFIIYLFIFWVFIL